MTTTKHHFKDFRCVYNNDVYSFRTYDSFISFKLMSAPCILVPLLRCKYLLELRKERQLEARYLLPDGYLSGLAYKVKDKSKRRPIAAGIAHEYHLDKIQKDVSRAINKQLPPAIEMYNRHASINFSWDSDRIEPLYQIMEARYSLAPTYQSPRSTATSCHQPEAPDPASPQEAVILELQEIK